MSDDVEALAEVIYAVEFGTFSTTASEDHNRWTWHGTHRNEVVAQTCRDCATALLDAIPDLLRADSAAGRALRHTLGLRLLVDRDHPSLGRRRCLSSGWEELP